MTAAEALRPEGRRGGIRSPATMAAFGTFGELLQGRLPERPGDFLVTLPIGRWSTARFVLDGDLTSVRVWPASKLKSRWVAERMLGLHGVHGGGILIIWSDLPEGKGMASSSADLVATARAVGHAIGREPDPGEIEDLLRAIEPTDGVMYPDVVAFHHRAVRLRARLGVLPPLTIVAVDEGGMVDTVSDNRTPRDFSIAEEHYYERLLVELADAIRAGDPVRIGAVATASATLNQR